MDQFSDTSEDDDDHVNKKLKGRSRAEKKRILKELEQVKQLEIHMNYKMERQ